MSIKLIRISLQVRKIQENCTWVNNGASERESLTIYTQSGVVLLVLHSSLHMFTLRERIYHLMCVRSFIILTEYGMVLVYDPFTPS